MTPAPLALGEGGRGNGEGGGGEKRLIHRKTGSLS